MVFRIAWISIIVLFCACLKDKGGAIPPNGSISFSANGKLYSWVQNNNQADTAFLPIIIFNSGSGAYLLSVSNALATPPVARKELRITIPTSNLSVNIPYTFTNSSNTNPPYPHHVIVATSLGGGDPSTTYNASESGDYITLIITRIQDGRAYGLFSGKLTRASDKAKIDITGGVFESIEIAP